MGGRSTWAVALTTATSRSLRSRPLPPFTLASPTVAESLMAPHALRQLLCTDVPIRAAGLAPSSLLPVPFAPQVVAAAAGSWWLARGRILPFKNSIRISDWRDVRGCSWCSMQRERRRINQIKTAGSAAGRRPGVPGWDWEALSLCLFGHVLAGCRRSAGPKWSLSACSEDMGNFRFTLARKIQR